MPSSSTFRQTTNVWVVSNCTGLGVVGSSLETHTHRAIRTRDRQPLDVPGHDVGSGRVGLM